VRGAMTADLCGAVPMLAGAVRAILCSVEENLKGMEDEGFVRAVRDWLATLQGPGEQPGTEE